MRRAGAVLGLLGALACASPALAAVPRPGPGVAAPAAPDPAALRAAADLVEASGLGRQLERLAARVRDDLRQRHGASPADAAAIDRATARHFDGERLVALARAGLARRLQPAPAAGALAWFRTPLARRIVVLELDAIEPGQTPALEAFVEGLARTPPSARRLALLGRLDDAGRATETSLDVAAAVVATLARALGPPAPAGPAVRGAAAEPWLLERRARAWDRMREVTLLGMLFAYRALADDELERLVAFVESDAGQWFVNATSEVVVRALGAATEESAPEVARAMHRTGGRTRR
ncbi:MAG TPA: hypothetical protein DDZ42_19775 [Candidatus Rokubacteria bacterium]|nr:hypothetical protein [Candidatus Rokubacteria bacterium]